MSEKKPDLDLYFVEATEEGPIIFLDTSGTEIIYSILLDEDDVFEHPEQTIALFLDPNEAIERFKAFALAKIAHLRAEADFLMNNIKSIQPMEDLK